MNAHVKIRLTQIAGLLMLLAWWLGSAQPASAKLLPPNGGGETTVPAAPAPIVVHDHTSVWSYLLVAAVAVVATLALVWATRVTRRAITARPSKRLRPAAA